MHNFFHKFIATICCIACWLAVQAQAPQWVNDAYRDMEYPHSTFFTGFSAESVRESSQVEQVKNRLILDAKKKLSESIRVQLKTSTDVRDKSAEVNGRTSIASYTDESVQAYSNVEVVDVKTETYYDAKGKTVYAFAAVRRSTLAAFYGKQISIDLNKVDVALGMLEQLMAAGKKQSALQQCGEAQKVLNGIASYRDLLTAVNPAANEEEAMQTVRFNALQSRISQLAIELEEQSIAVFVSCQYEYKGAPHDAFGHDPGIICDIMKQAVSEHKCTIAADESEADYTLTLYASTMQRSDGSGQYGIISYYANVRGNLYNRTTRKKTAEFAIFNDAAAYATGKSPQDAATKAFKLPALRDKILDKVLPKIGN